MIQFLDGPAEGETLMLRRAPHFLRVVISPRGNVDALDQIDDEPRPRERIFVYRLASTPSRYHIRCSPRSSSGMFMQAKYRLFDPQPADEVLRDTKEWQAWASLQAEFPRLMT